MNTKPNIIKASAGLLFLVFGLVLAAKSFAITGPSAGAGVGSGLINVEPTGTGNLSVGATAADTSTKFQITGTTANSSAFGLKVWPSSGSVNFQVRNDGIVSIASTTYVGGGICFGAIGATDCMSSWSGVGGGATTTNAGLISPGIFNSQTGLGNATYYFPTNATVNGNLSVGTSTATTGALYVNGNVGIGTASPATRMHVAQTAQTSTREMLIKASVSDGGNDAFYVANGTVTDGRFLPTFAGYLDSTSAAQSLLFRGLISAANDSGTSPIVSFQAARTNSTSDPNNGGLDPASVRPTFSFLNSGTSQMTISAAGGLGVGTAVPGARIHAEGADSVSAIFVSTNALSVNSGAGMVGYAKALPTAADQRLGYFLLGSRGGAENGYNAVGMAGFSEGAWTAGSSYPSYITFATTPSGSASRSERVRITSSGNVGIATTTPTYPLTVAGTIHSSTGGYRFPDGTTQTTAATAGTNYFTLSGASLYPTSTAYNLGLGTASPTGKLQVVGVASVGAAGVVPGGSTTGLNLTAAAGAAGTASTGIFFGGDGIAHANIAWMPFERSFILRTGNSTTQTTDSYSAANLLMGGNLGVGTASVDTNYRITTAGGGIKAESTTQPAGYFNSSSGYGLIVNTGNVGIGTVAPSYLLEVNKAQDASTQIGLINANNTANASAQFLAGIDSSHLVFFGYRPTGHTAVPYWANKGYFGATSQVTGFLVSAYNPGQTIEFQTGGLTANEVRMHIGATGNVGIATTTPGSRLTVAGTIYSSTGGYKFPDGTTQTTAATAGTNYFTLSGTSLYPTSTTYELGVGTASVDTNYAITTAGGGIKAESTTQPAGYFNSSSGYGLLVNTGYVGIGTTNPQAPLNVVGSVLFGGTSAGSIGNVQITTGGTSPINNRLTYGTDGTGWKFAISKNQAGTVTDQIVIQDNGNVGIATTTPTYPLTVAGTIHSSTGGYRFPDGTTQTTAATAGTNYFTLSGNSLSPTSTAYNLGLGTATPGTKLHISMGNEIIENTNGTTNLLTLRNISNTDQALYIGMGGQTGPGGRIAGQYGLDLRSVYDNAAYYIDFATADSERMRITNAGNVGIGTTTPAYRLDVSNGGTTAYPLQLTSSGKFIRIGALNTSYAHVDTDAASGFYFYDQLYAGGGNNLLNLSSGNSYLASAGGNVGIGTATPQGKLGITKDTATSWNSNEADYAIKITDGSDNVGLLMGVSTAVGNTAAIQVMDPGTSWTGRNLLLQPVGGNVGIGTTTPTSPLVISNTSASPIISALSAGSANPISIAIGRTAAEGRLAIAAGAGQFATDAAAGDFVIRTESNTNSVRILGGTGATVLQVSSSTVIVAGGTGKINAGTIDPPYTINGEQYATYLSGMTGQKEETTGEIDILCHPERSEGSRLCSAAIDFGAQEKGSDLWLFAKITNLKEQMSKMSVLLTPTFDGKVWYEKDVKNNTLKIFASPVNSDGSSVNSLSVSYRLTSPRFDSAKWSNTRNEPGVNGFVIND